MAISISTKYPGRATSPTSAHPFGSFKNETSENSDDGTPLEKDWQDEVFALRDCILSAAGVTPNGNIDTVTASQVWNALKSGGTLSLSAIGEDGTLEVTDGSGNVLHIDKDRIALRHFDGVNFKSETSLRKEGVSHYRRISTSAFSLIIQQVLEFDISSWNWNVYDTHMRYASLPPQVIDMDTSLGNSIGRVDGATVSWTSSDDVLHSVPALITVKYDSVSTSLLVNTCKIMTSLDPKAAGNISQKLIITTSL